MVVIFVFLLFELDGVDSARTQAAKAETAVTGWKVALSVLRSARTVPWAREAIANSPLSAVDRRHARDFRAAWRPDARQRRAPSPVWRSRSASTFTPGSTAGAAG